MTSATELDVLAAVPDTMVSTQELATRLPDMKRSTIAHALRMLTAERLIRRVKWGVYEITVEGQMQREKLHKIREGMVQG